MFKYPLLAIVLIINGVVCGQQVRDSAKTKRPRQLQLGFIFSPDLCTRFGAESYQTPKFGFTQGIVARYSLTNFMWFETGAQLSDKGYKTKWGWSDFYTSGPLIWRYRQGRDQYHFYYLDIPLKLDFNYNSAKTGLFATVGVTLNVFLFEQVVSNVIDYDEGRQPDIITPIHANNYPVSISPTVGLGLNYHINKTMELVFAPTARFSVLPVSKADSKVYLWTFGLNVYYVFGVLKQPD